MNERKNELYDLITDLKRKIITEQSVESLSHHGIKGMRWGVRRRRGRDGRVVGGRSKRPPASDDHKQARALKAKGVRALSTNELRELNQRLQMERQFKELNPSKLDRAAKTASKIMKDVTTMATVYSLTKKYLGRGRISI